MPDPYAHAQVDAIIDLALAEDLGASHLDVTCAALVPTSARLFGHIIAKDSGVLCGVKLMQRVCDRIGAGVTCVDAIDDGISVVKGTIVLRFAGPAGILLQAERTALNLMQRLSGTATLAHQFAQAVQGTRAQVFDTRKTTPGLRLLQKHAVRMGGAMNHRIGLFDQILIKENHIALAGLGGPAQAVLTARQRCPRGTIIEVEIERLDDLESVISNGADIILLDNMTPSLCAQAVQQRGNRMVALEASGGITLANVRAYAESGVERISVGALTHSAACLDLSMRCSLTPP